MALAPIGGLHVAARDQAFCGLHRAGAKGGSVWSVVGDLFGGLHPGTLRVRYGRERVLREARLSVVGMRDLREAPRASGGTPRRRSTQSLTRLHGRVKEKTNRCGVVSNRRCRAGSCGPHARRVNQIVSVSRHAKREQTHPIITAATSLIAAADGTHGGDGPILHV